MDIYFNTLVIVN